MAFMDVLTHASILRRRAAGNPPAAIEDNEAFNDRCFVMLFGKKINHNSGILL
jgi:hypothetical protein